MARKTLQYAVTAITALLVGRANAGAGAQVYGCIFMRYSPAQPFVAKFIHGGQKIHCMIHGGYDNSVRVTRSGVTCADIQYVESKASSSGGDLCATDTSYWGLSYSTSGSEPVYSGDMISRWQTGNSADFVGTFSKGTRFCKNQTYCEYTSVDWPSGTQGPLYVVFNPLASNTDTTSTSENIPEVLAGQAEEGEQLEL